MSIYDLEFTTRTHNCLLRAGIKTLEQLRELSDDDLRNIRNLNEKCICEIKSKLAAIDKEM